jgi:hypothetical protein
LNPFTPKTIYEINTNPSIVITEILKIIMQMFIRNLDVKSPFERLRCRWEDNIKIFFKEIGYDGVD